MTLKNVMQAILQRTGLFLVATVLLSACVGPSGPDNYSNLAQNLRAKGHLRTDLRPVDAPITLTRLEQTFRDVVFQYEFHFKDGRLINERISKPLKRWHGQIRYTFTGDAVTPRDRSDVRELMDRLEPLTGLSFVEATGKHDMLISIASQAGRREVSRQLARADMPTYKRRYDIWRSTPGWICGATLSASWDDPAHLVYAHVFLGDEPDRLLRTACLHEEIVQALGLTNDSDRARPSIFNDDQEFALLTEHDEILLNALYDRRLWAGMTENDAAPMLGRVLSTAMAAKGVGPIRLSARGTSGPG